MDIKISIKKQPKFLNSYWVIVEDILMERTEKFSVHIPPGGGMWINEKQVQGTSQFSGGNTDASQRSALRRYFERHYA